jgi:hypothetical protein
VSLRTLHVRNRGAHFGDEGLNGLARFFYGADSYENAAVFIIAWEI